MLGRALRKGRPRLPRPSGLRPTPRRPGPGLPMLRSGPGCWIGALRGHARPVGEAGRRRAGRRLRPRLRSQAYRNVPDCRSRRPGAAVGPPVGDGAGFCRHHGGLLGRRCCEPVGQAACRAASRPLPAGLGARGGLGAPGGGRRHVVSGPRRPAHPRG
eukprot:11947171-Alexandrium_andersonii.AAC.1